MMLLPNWLGAVEERQKMPRRQREIEIRES
jgi:hypothetical protein